MITKREIFEQFAKGENCINTECENCPFHKPFRACTVGKRLLTIGAMAILRQNRKKRVFDKSKILTCVTADKAKVGMLGYFGDNLDELKANIKHNVLYGLLGVCKEDHTFRFEVENTVYALFYPIEEVEE